MATIRLAWDETDGAASYNLYHDVKPGLSTRFTSMVANTATLTYDHVVNVAGNHYYIVVAVGPNNEVGPPSAEIVVNVTSGNTYGRGLYGRILWG